MNTSVYPEKSNLKRSECPCLDNALSVSLLTEAGERGPSAQFRHIWVHIHSNVDSCKNLCYVTTLLFLVEDEKNGT